MLIFIYTVGGAALAVVAYTHLRQRSPEAATAGLRAVRELSAVILVGAKAIESVVNVLAGQQRLSAEPTTPSWRYRNYDEFDDEDDR